MRILHLTDLHLLDHPEEMLYGVKCHDSLKQVLDAAFSLSPRPSLIVVTGDISETATAQSYQLAYDLLSNFGVPVFAVPGNHDEVGLLEDRFSRFNEPLPFSHGTDRWNFIFLNSKTSGKDHGRMSPEQMVWLREVLTEDHDRYVALCLHHSLAMLCDEPGCQFKLANGFVSFLQDFKHVKLVLTGHLHVEQSFHIGGLTCLTTPSTAMQVVHPTYSCNEHRVDAERRGFRIIDLDHDGEFSTQVHWLRNRSTTSQVDPAYA